MERSVYSDRNVFAKNCYEKGLINDIEWKTYLNWFEWLSKKVSVNGDAYIYLRTSPEKSYEPNTKTRVEVKKKRFLLDYIRRNTSENTKNGLGKCGAKCANTRWRFRKFSRKENRRISQTRY